MIKRPKGCKCHPDSAFLWAQQIKESFAMKETTMRTRGERKISQGQVSTLNIERLRENGQGMHTLHGLGNREKEMTRLRDFKTYSKAKKGGNGASS